MKYVKTIQMDYLRNYVVLIANNKNDVESAARLHKIALKSYH